MNKNEPHSISETKKIQYSKYTVKVKNAEKKIKPALNCAI